MILPLVLEIGLTALAGAVYTNDTGETAYGFRIAFSAPVAITSHAPVFPVQEPEGEATAFVFTDGEVPPGGTFWLSWRPANVAAVNIEWILLPVAYQENQQVTENRITLKSPDGQAIQATLRKVAVLQQVPFTVTYSILGISQGINTFTWEVRQPEPGPHYESFPVLIRTSDLGRTMKATFWSNRPIYTVQLKASDSKGKNYVWTDAVQNTIWVREPVILASDSYSSGGTWEQVFADATSLLYVTTNLVEIRNVDDITYFVPKWPGNYRFKRTSSTGKVTEVEVLVRIKTERVLKLRGAFMGDYYGPRWWGTSFRHIDSDVIERAVDYVKKLNANTFCLVNFAGYLQFKPFPLLRVDEGGPAINMTRLATVANLCNQRGLEIYLHLAVFNLWPYLTIDEYRSYWSPDNDETWYVRNLQEIERFAMYNIEATQNMGIDFLTPQARAGNMYFDGKFQRYRLSDKIQAMLSRLKSRFHGYLGWADPYPEYNNTFLKTCAFIHLFLNVPERFDRDYFADPSCPTPDEVRRRALEYLRRYEGHITDGLDVYVNVSAISVDAQVLLQGEPPRDAPVDFQEQVAFLEGFFQAVYETDWIDGVAAWCVDWYEWSPNIAMITGDPTFASFRGKPAEEVVRLWFDMLDGSP